MFMLVESYLDLLLSMALGPCELIEVLLMLFDSLELNKLFKLSLKDEVDFVALLALFVENLAFIEDLLLPEIVILVQHMFAHVLKLRTMPHELYLLVLAPLLKTLEGKFVVLLRKHSKDARYKTLDGGVPDLVVDQSLLTKAL